jgi:uncharacterized repeat protein (TIGR03803 family)
MKATRLALTVVTTLLLAAMAGPSQLAAQDAAPGYKVLYSFKGNSDGEYPLNGTLVQDKAGNLYGTTSGNLNGPYGTVFMLTASGKETVLYNFTGGADGGNPFSGLVLSRNTLYGTTFEGGGSGCECGVVFAVNIKKKTETVLYSFTLSGYNPYVGLVQDNNGNLYGTTHFGGADDAGVVFELVPKTKKYTVLYTFTGSTDGGFPDSVLTFDKTGEVLYGTTWHGGTSNQGVVFSLTLKGDTYKVLYNFTGSSDGGVPSGTMALDPKGNLYGTTQEGGSGYGVVFKVVPKTGKETVLYTFTGGKDGGGPFGVVRDQNGTLYGATFEGGDLNCGGGSGCGTVFKVVKTTGSVLHAFNGVDGEYAYSGVLLDSKGDLFGTTEYGGSSGCGGFGCGVVYKLTP